MNKKKKQNGGEKRRPRRRGGKQAKKPWIELTKESKPPRKRGAQGGEGKNKQRTTPHIKGHKWPKTEHRRNPGTEKRKKEAPERR